VESGFRPRFPVNLSGAQMDYHRPDEINSQDVSGTVSPMQKTVLVVEDNELNMKLFNDLLEAHGYRVVQTRDGLSALDMARKHNPDLILMDIQLPEVSGIEVTKWLKEDDQLRRIPVIAVTAFAMKGDEQKIREGGCEAYISKPISVMSFLQTIDGFLKTKQ
jgi:two-component system, cell cycle response regulator DivK